MAETYLSPRELSELLELPLPTLARWRYQGTGPRFARIGRHVRYRRADVDTWVDAQMAR